MLKTVSRVKYLRFWFAVDVAEGQGKLFCHDFGFHFAPCLSHLFFFLLAQLANCWDVSLRNLVTVLHVILQFLAFWNVSVLVLQLDMLQLAHVLLLLELLVNV